MSADLRVSRTVPAPGEHVWRVLTDWSAQSSWMPLTRVRPVGEGQGREVGSRIEAWTGFGRIGFLDTMIVTSWEPPDRCEVMHTGRVVRGPGVFAVEALGPYSCRVVWEEHLHLPLGALGRLGWVVVVPLARAGLRYALRRFAAYAV